MTKAFLKIEFLGYWRSGSGGSGGGDVDTAALRDKYKLPYVPAKQYKGILREAAQRLAETGAGGWTPVKLDMLFGSKAQGIKSNPGCLDFRDAKLSLDIYKAIQSNSSLLPTLFVQLASTKVKHQTGVAETNSLRSVEAVVPLTLVGDISWSPEDRKLCYGTSEHQMINNLENEWIELLKAAACLCIAVGGQRSDGLGRAILSVNKEGAA